MEKNVAIVGAGASGLMCASTLCQNPKLNITLFDSNSTVGKKILLTGNGRCNVTNLCNPQEFLNNVCCNQKFLISAINLFSPFDMLNFLLEHKVKTCVEENNRVFPISNRASSITEMFLKIIENAKNINLKLGTKVTGVIKTKTGFEVEYNGMHKDFDCVVVATGGLSYPVTGCHGEGIKFALNLGVKVAPTRPALCGIKIKENLKDLVGVSFNVKLGFKNQKAMGSIMITNYGISGPAAFLLSSQITEHSIGGEKLIVDFLPSESVASLNEKISLFKASNAKKQILSLVSNFVNIKLSNLLLDYFNIQKTKQVSQLTSAEANKIVNALKFMELTIAGFDDIEHATITRGGVDVADVNPKTMECKIVPNLYFVGEVLNVDALSGGFNLQIAFSTAVACAKAIMTSFNKE